MKRTTEELAVVLLGLITSVLTGFVLAFIQSRFDLSIYGLSFQSIFPWGALVSGYVAASGYYVGSRIFQHRPTWLFPFNVMTVATATYFVLKYLSYQSIQTAGLSLQSSITFSAFLDSTIRAETFTLGGKDFSLGPLGYVVAGIQVLGFGAGGLDFYQSLLRHTYCEACGRYSRRAYSVAGYETSPDRADEAFQLARRRLSEGDQKGAVNAITRLRAEAANSAGYQVSLNADQCSGCGSLLVRLAMAFSDDGNWTAFGGRPGWNSSRRNSNWTPVDGYELKWTFSEKEEFVVPAGGGSCQDSLVPVRRWILYAAALSLILSWLSRELETMR